MNKIYLLIRNHFDYFFLFFISVFYFLLMTFDLNSWYYSAIGDEYASFNLAKNIAKGLNFNIFSQKGVYGIVPVATSVYQAIFMKFFGLNNFGWRISSVFIVIFTFWPFYFFAKDIFNRKTAVFSTFIFAFSHYIWSFAHTGYWNIQVIYLPIVSLFLIYRGIKRENIYCVFFAGLTSGMSFYTYFTARITFFLGIIVIFKFYLDKHRFKLLKYFFIYFIGFIILFIPYFITNGLSTFLVMFDRSVVLTNEFQDKSKLSFFLKNTLESFKSFYHNPQSALYVSGPLIDPITAILTVIGIILIALKFRNYFFLPVILFIFLIITGGFSPYPNPPLTRLFFMVPFISLIAGFGIYNIFKLLIKMFSYRVSILIIFILFFGIFSLNWYQFYKITPYKMQLTDEAVIIGAIKSYNFCKSKYVIYKYFDPLLKPAIEAFNLNNNITLLKEFNRINFENNSCIIFGNKEYMQYSNNVLSYCQNNNCHIDEFYSPSKNTKAIVIFSSK